jgi:hypothetical protein
MIPLNPILEGYINKSLFVSPAAKTCAVLTFTDLKLHPPPLKLFCELENR